MTTPATSQEIEPFHAIAISRLAHTLQAQGRDVVHMEFGQPSTGAPARAVARAREVLGSDPMGYWESAPLRERIARRYGETYGLDLDPERVILTCGASPALVTALIAGCRPGARVAMARPGYVAYRNVARALHLDPVEIPAGAAVRYQLTAAALEALDPAPDAVIVASPANPTGTLITPSGLAALAETCRRRGILCVSDEIYHGLSYVGAARSMLEFDADAFVVNSFSKYFSMPGWRLGWLVAPERFVARARACVGNLFLTPPSLSQHAALVAFEEGEELDAHLLTYRRNRTLMLDALPRMGLSSIAPPDGAFYIYADVSRYTEDSLAFCERLLRDTGVATAPGIDFDPVDGHRFMRFSFAVSTPLVETALRRLVPWFRSEGALGAR